MNALRTITVTALGLGVLALAAPRTVAAQTSPEKNLVEVAAAAGSFETLLAAAGAADLVATLESDGPFTLFAPTDDAFAALPVGTVEALLEPENREKLRSILLYHVVPGRVTAGEVVKLESAKTALGPAVDIEVDEDGQVRVAGARVVTADIHASNGVIHVIDAVILPPEK